MEKPNSMHVDTDLEIEKYWVGDGQKWGDHSVLRILKLPIC